MTKSFSQSSVTSAVPPPYDGARPIAPPRSNPLRGLVLVLFLGSLYLPLLFVADDRYWLPLFARYMAIALFALSVDIIWGYTGLLSLGQGLFFGIGAYATAYSLVLQGAAMNRGKPLEVLPDMALTEFMIFGRLPAVPGWMAPFIHIWFALAVAIILPTLVAYFFGLATFRRGIKGVYFSLITQALVLAIFELVNCALPYTGGVVGMPGLPRLTLFGHSFQMVSLYLLVTTTLVICFVVSYVVLNGKLGKLLTAIRDNENRVMALGYNTAMYKTFAFVVAGMMAGLAGALYVGVQRTVGPELFGVAFSIEIVILVAVGGRGTLYGAVIGAVLVHFTNTVISSQFTEAWPILLGSLFILVTLFLPEGIVGWLKKHCDSLAAFIRRKPTTVT
jgi:urea transport system permease protein